MIMMSSNNISSRQLAVNDLTVQGGQKSNCHSTAADDNGTPQTDREQRLPSVHADVMRLDHVQRRQRTYCEMRRIRHPVRRIMQSKCLGRRALSCRYYCRAMNGNTQFQFRRKPGERFERGLNRTAQPWGMKYTARNASVLGLDRSHS